MPWDKSDVLWIRVMDKLMTMMFGVDFLEYDFDKKKICHVPDSYTPTFVYSREEWLREYTLIVSLDDTCMGTNQQEQEEKTLQSEVDVVHEDESFSEEHNIDPNSDLDVLDADDIPPNNLTHQDSIVAVFPPRPSMAKVTVLQMDMDTLDDGQEMNDSIVDFFMIAEERHERACSFTRKVDLFKIDFVFIPVCRSGHWFLALVYNLPLLHSERFIRCEWAVTRGTVDTRAPEFSDKSMPVFYPKVPQQENGYDCGVFLLNSS
ncbi:sentrin-specific protease 7-like [Montipora capricornis]|uniref:sentrin-specific protease 7-like n=1 Tax=Montipora capricornis TaxID=246305 RepID=UPI0035F1486E